MSLFRRGDVWWYEFWFAGRRIQESSKSPSKTSARTAEQNPRRELESIVKKQTDAGSSGQQTGQAEGSLQKALHGLQNGVPRPTSHHASAQLVSRCRPVASTGGVASPEMRSDPITPEKREQIIAFMTGGLMTPTSIFRKSGKAISASMHLNP